VTLVALRVQEGFDIAHEIDFRLNRGRQLSRQPGSCRLGEQRAAKECKRVSAEFPDDFGCCTALSEGVICSCRIPCISQFIITHRIR
jgi:hypothetical protein